jgi:YggT family protein
MFVIGNLLSAVANVIDFLAQALVLVLFVNALLSWVRPDPSNPIVMFLDRISDAVCNPVRRMLPTVFGGIDFAPFIVMLVLWFGVRLFLVKSLMDLAIRL